MLKTCGCSEKHTTKKIFMVSIDKTLLTHVSRKAFRRHLENYNGTPFLIFLSGEKFAGQACPDRLLFERYEEKKVCLFGMLH